MARKRIGELLLERGAISQQQLDLALKAQQQTRQRLGLTLIEQKAITEDQLAHVLAQSLSLSVVDLAEAAVDWSAVHMLRARFCETHELFPFGIEGKGTGQKRLLVAMSDPLNLPAQEEIEFTTGLKVSPCVATHSQVRTAILRYYHKVSPEDAAPGKMSLVEKGGMVRLVDMTEDEPVVVGEEIKSGPAAVPAPAQADPALEKLIQERMAAAKAKKKTLSATVSRDLDFLFGGKGEDNEAVEKVERKFWALMRIMARKGLITREEFLREVDGEE